METEKKFAEWAIVELMGHQTIAGFVTEESIGGHSFIRVDVPGTDCDGMSQAPFTKMYGPGAIYAMTPTTEANAKAASQRLQVRPVSTWLVPERKQIPMFGESDSAPEDDYSDLDDGGMEG